MGTDFYQNAPKNVLEQGAWVWVRPRYNDDRWYSGKAGLVEAWDHDVVGNRSWCVVRLVDAMGQLKELVIDTGELLQITPSQEDVERMENAQSALEYRIRVFARVVLSIRAHSKAEACQTANTMLRQPEKIDYELEIVWPTVFTMSDVGV